MDQSQRSPLFQLRVSCFFLFDPHVRSHFLLFFVFLRGARAAEDALVSLDALACDMLQASVCAGAVRVFVKTVLGLRSERSVAIDRTPRQVAVPQLCVGRRLI